MAERQLDQDKARVLAHLKEARKFMPYLHEGRPVHYIEKLLGNRDRAWRAILALVQDRKVEYEVNCSPDYVRAFADMPPAPTIERDVPGLDEPATPVSDAIRQTFASAANDQRGRVREAIAPRPKYAYPAPWRISDTHLEDIAPEHVIVVCAEGHYTCEAPTRAAAEAIVLAVNTLAGVSE